MRRMRRKRAPRTRGWTVQLTVELGQGAESPAHAGMDRFARPTPSRMS